MAKRCLFGVISWCSSKVIFDWASFVWTRLAARRPHSFSGEPFASVAASWLGAISWEVFARVIGVFGRTVLEGCLKPEFRRLRQMSRSPPPPTLERSFAVSLFCLCCCFVLFPLLFRCFVCDVVSLCFRRCLCSLHRFACF